MEKVRAITIILISYWVVFTVRKHLAPRLKKALVANAYDAASKRPGSQEAAQRKYRLLKAAGWALRRRMG